MFRLVQKTTKQLSIKSVTLQNKNMTNFFKHNLAIFKSKLTNMDQIMDTEKHKEFDLLKEEVEKVG